jgi:hypothetical protein
MFHWANPQKNETRRTKYGASIEMTSFGERLANTKKLCPKKVTQTEKKHQQINPSPFVTARVCQNS